MNLNIFYCITDMKIESKEHDWLTRTDILSIIKRVRKKTKRIWLLNELNMYSINLEICLQNILL